MFCGAGHYVRVLRDFNLEDKDGHTVTIPQVATLRCDACEDEIVPAASHHYIERRMQEESEQLSPAEVRTIFESFNRTQATVCEDLGLGMKTLLRWLNGTQHPSRALGLYLRVAAEFPQVYEWIASRRWRQPAFVAALPSSRTAGGLVVNGHTFEELGAEESASATRWQSLADQNYAEQFRRAPFAVAGPRA